MKKLIFTLFVFTSVNVFASIPIRDKNGCVVGSGGVAAYGYKEDTKTTIPWYLMLGKTKLKTLKEIVGCPKVTKAIIEINIPIVGKVVGHLNIIFSDIYISVDKTSDVRYFPTRDVYVEETQSWSFKDMR